MWLCAVQILLGALEAEDAELLRHEDGLPLLLRLVHGPWRRGRRRQRRHAGQPPSRRAARRGRRREAPAGPRRAREVRGGEEEEGQRARGARRHGGGAGARVRCHPQPQQTLDAHVVVAFVALEDYVCGVEMRSETARDGGNRVRAPSLGSGWNPGRKATIGSSPNPLFRLTPTNDCKME